MEENNKNKSGIPVASLTLGIISIIMNLFWYITIPTGVLAIVFGAKSAKKMGSKMGKAGLVLGIVGLTLFVFAYIGIAILWLLAQTY